jgi:hypothetical protein
MMAPFNMEVTIMKRHLFNSLAAAALLAGALPAQAEGHFVPAAMANALSGIPVSLVQGIKASGPQGMPISTKFEIENGALQLSVYTMNRDQFSEVIVDHKTGAVEKSTAITAGEDLKDAGAQGAAMSKAKVSLETAIGTAEGSNAGYRAVSAIPSIDGGRPVATILLMKGVDTKSVTEKLD